MPTCPLPELRVIGNLAAFENLLWRVFFHEMTPNAVIERLVLGHLNKGNLLMAKNTKTKTKKAPTTTKKKTGKKTTAK